MHQVAKYFTSVLLVLVVSSAMGEDARISFDIAPQDLPAALRQLAQQGQLEILYDGPTVAGKKTVGVAGNYTPKEALGKLLEGTGLQYEFTADHAVAVKNPQRVAENDAADNAPKKPEAPPAKPEEEIVTLPEMTVTASPIDDTSYNAPNATTATKTDTPIMETPYSIKVVPQQVLQDQQAVRIDKALETVSGVIRFPGNVSQTDQFILRGFPNNEFYRDGFRFDAGRNLKRDTANLERVEVLKGPGSILFGRAEPGGIINLVTKQPLASPYYSLQQQFGSFDFYRTTVDATGPITKDDTLLYRFNLAYEDTESFRDFVENDRVFVAPVIQWNISERTQVKLELDYLHSKVFPDQGIPVLGNRPAPLPRERNLSEPSSIIEQDDTLVGLTWSHAFNDRWTLRHRFNASFIDNGDTLNFFFAGRVQDNGFVERGFQVFKRDIETYYNVLDLTGEFETRGIKHTLLMGGDYYREDLKLPILNNLCCSGLAINAFNPVYLPSIPVLDPANNILVDRTTDWYGLHLQDQIELPHDVHVLAGFRYDSAQQVNNLTGMTAAEDDRVSPRGGLLWRAVPWLSLYGSYTENFGSPNFTDLQGNALPPQTAQQWEVGAKTEFWDGRFSATFAYFDLAKQDIAVRDPINPLLTRTIGEAESRGVELDVAGEILPGWRVIGGYSYLPFAEVTKDVGFDGGSGTQGNRFHNAPRHAGSLFSTYEFLGGDFKGLKLGGGVVAVGQREGQVFEPLFQLPGYAVVNLLGSYFWKAGPTKLTAQLNVDNLLDKTYFTGSSSGLNGQFGAPRTFLGSIRVEF